jgi:xanthine dehydrogenase accessory factor
VGNPQGEGGRVIAAPNAAAIYGRAAELSRNRRPFAIATVVAVRRPTSARPGAHGIVHPDSTIEGWVGGSCAQPIVVREALHSLADGQPRLLRISREAPSDSRRGDGVIEVMMTCHSGGTLEIYVEPQLPAPALWIAGTTPIAGALAELGTAAGFAVTIVDPIAEPEAFPAAERVVASADLGQLDPGTSPYVVVATQGQWDEEALQSVLRRDVAYVGLVASPTRSGVVREYLVGEGVPADRVGAIRGPAGLDLGAETPAEVALSILAELIQVRRGRAPFVAAPGPATLAGAADAATTRSTSAAVATEAQDIVLLDPVCGMTVEREDARHLAEHEGVVYAFCSLGCRTRFMKDPTAYLPTGASSRH